MDDCIDALFQSKDFSSVEGSEQIQVHFVITDQNRIVFNFVFESLGFLFFRLWAQQLQKQSASKITRRLQ